MKKISDDSYNNASKDDLILMLIDNQNEIIEELKKLKVDKVYPEEFELLPKAPPGQTWQLVER